MRIRLGRYQFERICFLSSELQFIKSRIKSAAGQQLCVSSLLHNLPVVDHEDHIGPNHRGQTVRDHDRRFAFHQVSEGIEHKFLGLGIESG